MGINEEAAEKAVETKKAKYGKDAFSKWGEIGGKKKSRGYFGWLKDHPEEQRKFYNRHSSKSIDRVRRQRLIDKEN